MPCVAKPFKKRYRLKMRAVYIPSQELWTKALFAFGDIGRPGSREPGPMCSHPSNVLLTKGQIASMLRNYVTLLFVLFNSSFLLLLQATYRTKEVIVDMLGWGTTDLIKIITVINQLECVGGPPHHKPH